MFTHPDDLNARIYEHPPFSRQPWRYPRSRTTNSSAAPEYTRRRLSASL